MAGRGLPVIVFLDEWIRYQHGFFVEQDSWGTCRQGTTIVVAYTRLNHGKRDPQGVPQTGREIIALLRPFWQSLFQKEGQLVLPLLLNAQQPYIVAVGHSMGGLYAQLWARESPQDLAGMVLLVSWHPDQRAPRKAHRNNTLLRILEGIEEMIEARRNQSTTVD